MICMLFAVCLPRPMEEREIFKKNASSTTGGWSCWNTELCFVYVYHSEHYCLFFTLRMPHYFTVSFFVYICINCVHFCMYAIGEFF